MCWCVCGSVVSGESGDGNVCRGVVRVVKWWGVCVE